MMDTSKSSGLKLYSLGIVTKAKVRGDDFIEVTPIEDFSMDKGGLSPDSKEYKVSTPDQHGVSKPSSIKGGSVIKAKWVPFGHSNRETSPDVQPSETVILFRFADTSDYYWTTMMREPELRRLETVRYAFSNQPSGLAPYDNDSSYWFEVNTADKTITLHTSDNDGEVVKYDIELDTRNGTLEIKDDLGNNIFLESVEGRLTTTTANEVIVNTQRFVINASQSIEFNTPTITTNSESSTINASEHTENAASTVTGGLSVSGGGAGTASISGDVQVNGNITASGSIMDGGGNSNHHSH